MKKYLERMGGPRAAGLHTTGQIPVQPYSTEDRRHEEQHETDSYIEDEEEGENRT